MNSEPLVSAIIVNYNYGCFLEECIASVRAQTYGNLEIIVVDDGSSDDSRDILRNHDDTVRVILKENGGQASAFDAGVAASSGDVVCFLDSDDTWDANKVERVMAAFATQPKAEWVSHALRMADATLRPQGVVVMQRAGLIAPDARALAERRFTAGTSISMRRSLAERVFPLNSSLFAGDAVLLARCVAARAWGYALKETLGTYRRHVFNRYRDNDIMRLLEDQIVVTKEMARIVGIADATPNHKHAAILAYLAGDRWYSRRRLRAVLAGLATAFCFVNRPGLFVRQSSALLVAWLAPAFWLRRWRRRALPDP